MDSGRAGATRIQYWHLHDGKTGSAMAVSLRRAMVTIQIISAMRRCTVHASLPSHPACPNALPRFGKCGVVGQLTLFVESGIVK